MAPLFTREELIASRLTTPEIADHLRADSLGYLSREGLRAAVEGRDEATALDSDVLDEPV